jgi:glycosyltransferase involved in cell wall biosynthesis
MSPQICLVMPCYNGMKYIAQAVESVVAQSFRDWRLIISDDGSNDGTIQYLESLRDPRIEVHFQPKNLGIFGNLNFLFARVTSPLTQILCQDDFLTGPDALQMILETWRNLPPEIAFVRSNYGSDGSGLFGLEQSTLPPIISAKDSDFYFFIFGCLPGNLSNVSVRTKVVEQMGWYRTDLPYFGDYEFWSRTGRTRPWALSRSHVSQVRSHSEQASRTLNKRGEVLPQVWFVIHGLLEQLRAQGHNLFDLRLYATGNYVVRHMDAGLTQGLKGRGWGYLRRVNQEFFGRRRFLGRGASWLIYAMTGGGRFFLPALAKRLIARRQAAVRHQSAL